MNNPEIIVKNAPFKHFCMSIGAIPTSYKDSLDYYETLLCLIKYLEETVIPAVNNNAAALSELQRLFTELHDYVENYFSNLDVQEEINNKLDEMADDGTLQEIVGDYLNASALWCFDNVEDMTKASNLINGSYARTYGFYETNDGGNALYKIRNITNEDIVDNKFLIAMENEELIAELIINDNSINVKQIGAQTDTDLHDYVLAIIDKNLKCFIPAGVWKTSPLQIAKYDSVRITGENIYGNNNSNGTILTPISNQDYIIKVGYNNSTSICNDINISNIEFNTNGFTCINALLFSRVQFSNFSELGFRRCICSDCAFRIRETWETRFGRLIFRQTDSPVTLIFGDKIGSGNISSNYFEFISIEGSRGHCIKFEENCAYSMNTIDTIDFESGSVAFDDEERVSINTPVSYTPLAVIINGNGNAEISINNLNLNAISQYAYTNTETGTSRAFDRVIECDNTDTGYFNYAIGNISGVGNVNTPILINANSFDKLVCNSNIFRAGLYFNSYVGGCRKFDYLNNDFAKNFTKANYERAYRDLKINGTEAYCEGKDHAVRVASLITKGTKLYVHAKGTGNINYGGSDHVTLTDVENYTWFSIDVTSNIGDEVNLLLGTNTTVEIDDYFFTD